MDSVLVTKRYLVLTVGIEPSNFPFYCFHKVGCLLLHLTILRVFHCQSCVLHRGQIPPSICSPYLVTMFEMYCI